MAVRSVVGIVGAAISGPVLGLQILSHPLLKQRLRPVIYEQLSQPQGMIRGDGSSPQGGISFVHTAGAGVGLFPNGLFPLYELGLRDQLDAISCEMESLSVWRGFPDGSHKFLNNVKNAGWAADLQTCPRIVERQRLRMMLLERFQDLGGEVCWNKKLAGLESLGSAGVRAVFTDGVSKNVDLIIGADGVWSTVRKHILKERNPKTAELRWVPPFVRVGGIYGISSDPGAVPDSNSQKLGASKEACLVLLDQGHIGALPLEDGKIAWTIQYTEKHAPERTTPIQKEEISMSDPYQSKVVPGLYEPHSTAEFVRGYENIWHPTLGSFRPLFEASERIIRSPLRQFAWEQNEIQCGNVAVIGDAARVVPPYAGSSLAIEDATVLADSLLNNLAPEHNASNFSAALTEYARRRVPRSKKVANMASWQGTLSMGERWWWRWIRDFGFRLPAADPKVNPKAVKRQDLPWLFGERTEIKQREDVT